VYRGCTDTISREVLDATHVYVYVYVHVHVHVHVINQEIKQSKRDCRQYKRNLMALLHRPYFLHLNKGEERQERRREERRIGGRRGIPRGGGNKEIKQSKVDSR
jgi:hypothetical protein